MKQMANDTNTVGFDLREMAINFFAIQNADENELTSKTSMPILYRTRSQIALFQKVESAICDRGYYIIPGSDSVVCIKTLLFLQICQIAQGSRRLCLNDHLFYLFQDMLISYLFQVAAENYARIEFAFPTPPASNQSLSCLQNRSCALHGWRLPARYLPTLLRQ